MKIKYRLFRVRRFCPVSILFRVDEPKCFRRELSHRRISLNLTVVRLNRVRFSMNQLQSQTMTTLSELTSVIGQVDVNAKPLEVIQDSTTLDYDLLNNLTDDNQPPPPPPQPEAEQVKDDNVAAIALDNLEDELERIKVVAIAQSVTNKLIATSEPSSNGLDL